MWDDDRFRHRREVMWAAFRVFDTNGDGVITKDELARILKEEDNMAYVEMPPSFQLLYRSRRHGCGGLRTKQASWLGRL